MIDDVMVNAILELGNNPKIMKLCEPNIFCPQEIHEWQIRRIFKVIVKSLNQDEARAFVKFLQSEIIRHEDDLNQAKSLIGLVRKEILGE